ncbi:hypothetical protein Tco_1412928 [Tanacetum coccineum]
MNNENTKKLDVDNCGKGIIDEFWAKNREIEEVERSGDEEKDEEDEVASMGEDKLVDAGESDTAGIKRNEWDECNGNMKDAKHEAYNVSDSPTSPVWNNKHFGCDETIRKSPFKPSYAPMSSKNNVEPNMKLDFEYTMIENGN